MCIHMYRRAGKLKIRPFDVMETMLSLMATMVVRAAVGVDFFHMQVQGHDVIRVKGRDGIRVKGRDVIAYAGKGA